MSTAKKLQNKLFRAGRESSSSFPISDSPSGPHPQPRRVQATVFSTQSQELTLRRFAEEQPSAGAAAGDVTPVASGASTPVPEQLKINIPAPPGAQQGDKREKEK